MVLMVALTFLTGSLGPRVPLAWSQPVQVVMVCRSAVQVGSQGPSSVLCTGPVGGFVLRLVLTSLLSWREWCGAAPALCAPRCVLGPELSSGRVGHGTHCPRSESRPGDQHRHTPSHLTYRGLRAIGYAG